MRKTIAFLFLLIGVPVIAFAAITRPKSEVEITAATVHVEPPAPPVEGNALPQPDDSTAIAFRHLHDHVLNVMTSWPKGSKKLATAPLEEIASDIAAAILIEPSTVEASTGKACSTVHGSDRCFWGEGLNSDEAKGTLMAALGYWEGSRFAAYVDDGLCNNKAWRKTSEGVATMKLGGSCDGGYAHSIWQIHTIEGSVCSRELVDGSRFGAARCALELARKSIVARGNLSWYTGESAYHHPKADERLEWARKAIKKFQAAK
jgi:hypothetical protein